MDTKTSKLGTYRAKRDFGRTKEPRGGEDGDTAAAPRFVVQRHRARRLHYDLRFEIDGVLVSFAVPRGPTLDPRAKRLAVRTEDHPIEYLDFEGAIPAGEYGGGDVIVWDRGTWQLHGADDAARALAEGELHVAVQGEELTGRLILIRRVKNGDGSGKEWLLLHKRDSHAVDGWNADEHPRSVLSGRTNEEVAAAPTAMWFSDRPAASAEVRMGPSGPLSGTLETVNLDAERSALDALRTKGTLTVGGRDVALTNLDKILFPARRDEAAVTKRELIAHYLAVAPSLLPKLAGRAVNLHRYPNGVKAKGFWQKEVPAHAPDWIARWHYDDAKADDAQFYVVADSAATLVWLANSGAIELHPWTSHTSAPHRPTYVIFDIDPGTKTTWDDVLTLARLHRSAFEHLHLTAFPKVTGKRGIQVIVPITGDVGFDETRSFAETISRSIGDVVPELVSWEWELAQRKGRARLDYTQNAINKTIVAPYCVRAEPGAPVSMPITWDELDDPDLRPDQWTIRNALTRLEQIGDLWSGIDTTNQQLPSLTQ